MAALARDHIEIGRLESARFGPFVSPVPIMVDAQPPTSDHGRVSRTSRRRVPGLLVAAGVVIVGVVALAAILGGGRVPGLAVASMTPAPLQTFVPLDRSSSGPASPAAMASRPVPTRAATPLPTATQRILPTVAPATPRSAASARPRPTSTVKPSPTPRIARTYTVKAGDTIKSIANKFGLKPRDLRAVNTIGADVVPGQRLNIPAGPVPTPAV